MIDKYSLLPCLMDQPKIEFELGCGEYKRRANTIGIDKRDMQGVDIIVDLENGFPFLPESLVDSIYSYHFLEHLENLDLHFAECYRILKPGGIVEAIVPHWSNPYARSDPTHKREFGLYTLAYYCKNTSFHRKVPLYAPESDFSMENISLIFGSNFRGINLITRIFGRLCNSSLQMLELYEALLTHLIPAKEIFFTLRKPKGAF